MTSANIEDYAGINLSSEVIQAQQDVNIMNERIKRVVDETRSATNARFLYGGYLEKRDIYQSSDHFGKDKLRNIHLGIDVWSEAGTVIYAAENGIVHSIRYNDVKLDYGHCMIIQYGSGVNVLYGHLSSYSIQHFKKNDEVVRGQIIGSIGDKMENGGWETHLHLQVIKDVGTYSGDYPGVCHEDELQYYQNNCPNPLEYIVGTKKLNQ